MKGLTDDPGRIGHYEIERELARGGMGVVYIARHTELGRRVALKRLLVSFLQTDSRVQRFELEAQAIARLDHPNIVKVHEVGQVGAHPFLVMELIEGESLKDRLRHGPFAPPEAAGLMASVARAVEHAHQHGVLHRDLKPANILVTPDGRPLLTDFGLARFEDEDRERLTRTGQLMGSPHTMSPEQADGDLEAIGPPTDIYSLGATLYMLLTGRPPFQGKNIMAVVAKVLSKEPTPLRELRPELDTDLETIVHTCLEKEPAKRYGSAAALADDLERYLAGESAGVWAAGWRKWALVSLGAVLIAIGVALVLTRSGQTPAPSAKDEEPAPQRPDEALLELDAITTLDRWQRCAELEDWVDRHSDHASAPRARERLLEMANRPLRSWDIRGADRAVFLKRESVVLSLELRTPARVVRHPAIASWSLNEKEPRPDGVLVEVPRGIRPLASGAQGECWILGKDALRRFGPGGVLLRKWGPPPAPKFDRHLAVSPAGDRVAYVSKDDSQALSVLVVGLKDDGTVELLTTLLLEDRRPRQWVSLCFDASGRIVVGSGRATPEANLSGSLHTWSGPSSSWRRRDHPTSPTEGTCAVTSIAIHDESNKLAVGDHYGRVWLYDLDSLKGEKRLRARDGNQTVTKKVIDLAFSKNGRWLYSLAGGHYIKYGIRELSRWDLTRGERELFELRGHPITLRRSSDGSRIVIVSGDDPRSRRVEVWSVPPE